MRLRIFEYEYWIPCERYVFLRIKSGPGNRFEDLFLWRTTLSVLCPLRLQEEGCTEDFP